MNKEQTPEAQKNWAKELAKRINFKTPDIVKKWRKIRKPFDPNGTRKKFGGSK